MWNLGKEGHDEQTYTVETRIRMDHMVWREKDKHGSQDTFG